MNKKENKKEYINKLNKVRALNLIDNSEKDYWGYITAHIDQIECLYDVYQEGMTFLDLGCGAGNVLEYAERIGYDVIGVDFNPELLKYTHCKTVCEDIKKLTKEFYQKFDVIYCYRPLKTKELKEYILSLESKIKPGTILITPDKNL